MTKKKIKDNYSFKEMASSVDGVKTLKGLYKVSEALGFKNRQIEEAFQKVEDLNNQFELLQEIPDKFNQYFAERGWIAFEMMNFDIMVQCVELAESGETNEAESVLIKYYNEESNLRFFINKLNSNKEFRIRKELIEKALEDHKNERYYASVPLVLMMIDGFVNDIEPTGFFAENTDLEVWDTIAAHSSGLNAIAKIFRKSRGKTTSDEITLPYRNGILHGRDLGYANLVVSTKTWAALFALGDWLAAIKKGKKGIKKEYTPPTLQESVQKIVEAAGGMKENGRQREHMGKWAKREMKVGIDFLENGQTDDYEEDTPEKTIVEFLNNLKKSNYGNMAKLISKKLGENKTIGKLAGEIRELFTRKKLIGYKLVSINDNAPAITEIETILEFQKSDDTKFKYECKFRLIYEDEDSEPVPRGYKKAQWRVMFNFRGIEFVEYKIN
ncbi:hypothetical protein ACIQXZ_29215 [Bacillus thuringiensis]|uniref:hypothetical protein n=1 Tax=Bacillus thuringiensis TaxID=1428 RepID=UPI003807C585